MGLVNEMLVAKLFGGNSSNGNYEIIETDECALAVCDSLGNVVAKIDEEGKDFIFVCEDIIKYLKNLIFSQPLALQIIKFLTNLITPVLFKIKQKKQQITLYRLVLVWV